MTEPSLTVGVLTVCFLSEIVSSGQNGRMGVSASVIDRIRCLNG
jgi:hypothetical protein